MRKRLYIALLCAMQVFLIVAQDEQRRIDVVVNDKHPVEINFESCSLSISAFESGNSEVALSIDLKNNTSSHYILLCESDYTEKYLRKEKIRFDKKSYGSTSRKALPCEGLENDGILRIGPSGNSILTINEITSEMKRCELPLYIARKTKISKKKLAVIRRVKIILNITIIPEKIVDEKYDVISQRCATLIEEISNISICTRSTHPISVQKQKEPYVDRIIEIKDEISEIKYVHHWSERDEEYQKYQKLILQLDNIEFNEKYCGKCGQAVSSHRCEYCNKSPKEILDEVTRIYRKLDNGDMTKSEAIRRVEPLRKAWNGGCHKLKQKMSSDTNNREKSERYYNDIVSY